jgi:flavorubredoxin
METRVTEIASKIYHLSTYLDPADLRFNQVLIDADQPLLFHTGMRGLFPLVSAAVARIMPLQKLRWISYGHHEADESGAMNEWLSAAPYSQVAVGEIACLLSANDQAIRAPRVWNDNETIDLGGKRVRYLATPHVPHCWDAGLVYEETTNTLLCGDLFTQMGNAPAETEGDIIMPAFTTEDIYLATSLTPGTASTIRRLAKLAPTTLALMHGPAFHGNGKNALQELATGYEKRCHDALKAPPA